MTDYLEELLEEQESEETRQSLEWRRLGRVLRSGNADESGLSTEMIGGAASQTGQSRQTRIVDEQAMAQTRTVKSVWQETFATQPLTEQIDRLRRAVRQVEGQTGRWMVRQAEGRTDYSVKAGIAGMAGGPAGVGGTLSDPLPSLRRTADYAAMVDAAFQRDARRYDGPLSLL